MTEQEEKDLVAILNQATEDIRAQTVMILAMREAFKLIATDPRISLTDCRTVACEVLERTEG